MPTVQMKTRAIALSLAAALAAGGCFLADPRPDPLGNDAGAAGSDGGPLGGSDAAAGSQLAVQEDSVAVSGGNSTTGAVAVVGLADAMLANVGVEITDTTSGVAPTIVAADASGSFAGQVMATTGDMVQLVVIADGPGGSVRGPAVLIAVSDGAAPSAPLAPGDPTPADATLGFDPVLVSVTADGMGSVTVTGASSATTPGAEVVAGDVATGASTSMLAAADGSFSLMLAGASGDTLVLFARDPTTGAASQTQVLTVP